MRAHLALAAAAALLPWLAPPAARGQEVLDQGIFLIAHEGVEVGREEFAIQATPGRQGRPGIRAVATDHYRDREVRVALDLTNEHVPVSYQADVTVAGRISARLSGQAGRGRFAVRIVSQAGEIVREFAMPVGAVVLDDDGFDQFYFLPRPDGDAPRPVSLLLPRQTRIVTGEVRGEGDDTVAVGGHAVLARRSILAIAGGETRAFWFSPTGSLLKVAVPSKSLTATRLSLPPR